MAKYTDEQIKKAKSHFKYGIDCDIFQEPVLTYAKIALDAIDLIKIAEYPNRVLCSKGLILTKSLTEYDELINDIASEAIKEFAENLEDDVKTQIKLAYPLTEEDSAFCQGVKNAKRIVCAIIKYRLKEMVGEGE